MLLLLISKAHTRHIHSSPDSLIHEGSTFFESVLDTSYLD